MQKNTLSNNTKGIRFINFLQSKNTQRIMPPAHQNERRNTHLHSFSATVHS